MQRFCLPVILVSNEVRVYREMPRNGLNQFAETITLLLLQFFDNTIVDSDNDRSLFLFGIANLSNNNNLPTRNKKKKQNKLINKLTKRQISRSASFRGTNSALIATNSAGKSGAKPPLTSRAGRIAEWNNDPVIVLSGGPLD
jgi:hypothetical protein